MGIYAKIRIKCKAASKTYLGLLNSGSSEPLSEVLDVGAYIIVPLEVSQELGIDIRNLIEIKKGECWLDPRKYIISIVIDDEEVEQVECRIYIKRGEDRIILPIEFMEEAKIRLDLHTRSWMIVGKTGWLKSAHLSEKDPHLLRYTHVPKLRKRLEELFKT